MACDQHFPTPNLPVTSVARAVECQANHSAHKAVLSHAASHMRMMMLHGDCLQSSLFRPLASPRRRKVIRMQIVNNSLRFNLESPHQVIERLFEEFETSQVFQIAQVLALVGKPPPRQSKNILQMASDGQQRRSIKGQCHTHRHKSPRSSDQLRRTIHHGGYRVIAALQNLAVVHQEGIGNSAQPRPCLLVVNGNRLLAQIGRGHHQRSHASVSKE